LLVNVQTWSTVPPQLAEELGASEDAEAFPKSSEYREGEYEKHDVLD
jgi:hypothetical protein